MYFILHETDPPCWDDSLMWFILSKYLLLVATLVVVYKGEKYICEVRISGYFYMMHLCHCKFSLNCRFFFSYIYTGAGHIIRISSKSWFISLIPFKKWNLYNVYIHSTQTDIFQVFISFNFDDYNWQLMKTPNSVSQKIRILLKTNTKKGFLKILANWKVWTWKVWACTALNT